jgi:hypothetical protein
MTIGTANPAMTAAMSCAGVLIGAPCGASLMLVSSPWVCERYSVTATSCSISATDDYRRKISTAARAAARCSAGVYPERKGRPKGGKSCYIGRPVDGWAETGYPSGLALASHPLRLPRCRVEAPVAQWIEYCPPKAGVAGSIPAGRTNSGGKFLHHFLVVAFRLKCRKRHLRLLRAATRSPALDSSLFSSNIWTSRNPSAALPCQFHSRLSVHFPLCALHLMAPPNPDLPLHSLDHPPS